MSDEEYKIKSYDEIYEELIHIVLGGTIKATDGNNGSVLCSILEAVARVIAEGYLHCKAGYVKYLEGLPESAFGLKKLKGSKAKGHVVFHTEEIGEEDGKKIYRKAEGNISVPRYIEVASGDIIFEIQEEAEIKNGETQSNPVLAIAKEMGEKGNVAIGAITTIVSSHNSQIHSVKNYEAFGNGRVAESDAMFKRRFVRYLRGLQNTNKDGVIEATLSAGVHYVNVVTYAPPKQIITNVTSKNIFQYEIAQNGKEPEGKIGAEKRKQYLANCIVYVADANGKCPPSLIQDVKEKIEGKGTPENPGHRPCGVNIAVLPIQTRRVFKGTKANLLIVAQSTFPDKEVATTRMKDVVFKFFRDFKVGQNLVVTDLIVAIRTLEWVKDVKIRHSSKPKEELNVAKIDDGELLLVEKEDIMVDLEWDKYNI